jgi:hypothetical protein
MPWATDPNLIQSLLSSSCWIVGQLETSDLKLQIAFPLNQRFLSDSGNTFRRGHFLLSIKVPDDVVTGIAVPSITIGENTTFDWFVAGERLADLAAIWFGKRFDYHGVVANGDIAALPNIRNESAITFPKFDPYNPIPRPDLAIELNLHQLKPVLGLLYRREPEERINAFWTATRFYANALRIFEADPEMAFLHLVIALEVISSQIEIPESELYDEQTRQDLEGIRQLISQEAANRVKSRLYQVRRRVVYTVIHLLKEAFFEGSRAEDGFRLIPDRIETCIKAVYDLRSQYTHGGSPFGTWFALHMVSPTTEINMGHPRLPGQQRELENLLADVPTFTGLERIVRFTVLSFAHHYLEPIHQRLD